MADAFTIKVLSKGAEQFFSENKISKASAIAVGRAAKLLHSELRDAVSTTYNVDSLDKYLINKTSSTQETGKNFVSSGLQYRQVYKDLSKVPYTFYEGNLNEPKDKKGFVHVVSVKRGSPKVSHGRYKRGGFVPKYKNGSPVRLYNGGAQMFERTTNRKYPLKLVLAPSTARLAMTMYDYSPRLQKVKNETIPSLILEVLLAEGL